MGDEGRTGTSKAANTAQSARTIFFYLSDDPTLSIKEPTNSASRYAMDAKSTDQFDGARDGLPFMQRALGTRQILIPNDLAWAGSL
jgi:hypothetical protein